MDNNIGAATMENISDFEHLKAWEDNQDLDYYLSDDHWNSHVNRLLYNILLSFYDKVYDGPAEVGAYLDYKRESFFEPTKDYSKLYGKMFNEAYRLCKYVTTTPVPETKIVQVAKEASMLFFRNQELPKGCRPPLPNALDMILSYHILGMVNGILMWTNDRHDSVDRFLDALYHYNDIGVVYRNGNLFEIRNHNFQFYHVVYLVQIVKQIIDASKLRPGYDYRGRDEYLRRKFVWYKADAENYVKLLEEVDKKKNMSEDVKPTNIIEHKYYNSNVYNAPVTINNYMQTEATSSEKSPEANGRKKGCGGKKEGRADNIVKEQEKEHGLPYPVFKMIGKTSSANVKALGSYLINVRGWIRVETRNPNYPIVNEIEEWTRLFNGEDNNSEFIFTGQDQLGKNKPHKIGVANLYCLFSNMAEQRLIEGNVGPIMESHFTDIDGHFLHGVNKNAKASKFADSIIKKALSYMSAQLTDEMVDDMLIKELLNEEKNREGERGKVKNINKQDIY